MVRAKVRSICWCPAALSLPPPSRTRCGWSRHSAPKAAAARRVDGFCDWPWRRTAASPGCACSRPGSAGWSVQGGACGERAVRAGRLAAAFQTRATNTLKYAAADTSVSVRVTVGPGTVHVDVEDTGPRRAPRARRRSAANGRGLVGMRERAAIYQGQVTAGPNREGGWSVHASLLTTSPAP
nr:ATP-binding protein [Streptomyces sp. NRRL WC-3774]